MAGFVVAGIVIALLAFGVVLRPLWREARGLAASVAVLLLAASTALYWLVGAPGAITQPTDRPATPRSLDEAIVQLRAALASHPEQAEGCVAGALTVQPAEICRSARCLRTRGRTPSGRSGRAGRRGAGAHACRRQRPPDPEAMRLLEHALAVQPDHQRARWFLGVVQRQAGEPAKASATWEPLLRVVDASTRPGLLEQINAARQDARLEPIQAPAAPTAAAASGKRLQVRVTLDAEFAKRAGLPGDTSVFVIARAADTPMPVAVEKHALRELPLTITLDDGDSPMPTRTLSSLDNVQLLARLSRSGNAMRQADDVESAPVTVALPAAAPVELVIGR